MSEVRDLVERLYDLIVRGVGGVSSSASSSSAGLGGSDGISFGYVKTWIHVSPDGVDTATGSVDDPVLTLGRAADLANGAVGTAGISLIGDIYPSGHVVGRLRNTVITGSAGAIVRGGVHIPVSQLERPDQPKTKMQTKTRRQLGGDVFDADGLDSGDDSYR